MEIPKIIHYIWIGNNPKPELVLKCIESWKKFMPDYEIREWNEDNYNIQNSAYLISAYNQKKWAFASDYIRFDILYQYGGIYFDTDVELLKPIPTEILKKSPFTAIESLGYVNPGLVYACNKGDWFAGKMLESYKNDLFDLRNIVTICERASNILEDYGLKIKDETQLINGLAIYSSNYFCGYDQNIREFDVKPETISVHHYASSWNSETPIKTNLRKLAKKVFGIRFYKRLAKLLGNKNIKS